MIENRFLRHSLAFIYAVGFFLVFLVVGFFATDFLLSKIILGRGVVEVPQFIGTDISQAKELAKYLSIKIDVAEEEHHDLPQGRIISQIPSKGRQIYKDRSINVTVSKGPKLIEIPVMTGLSLQNVREMFALYDLKLGEVKQHYSDTVPAGYVINTAPAFGSSVSAGKSVDVILSIGVDPMRRRTTPPPPPVDPRPREDSIF